MRVSNSTFNAIVMRYSNKEGQVRFDDFVACYIKLKTMFGKSSFQLIIPISVSPLAEFIKILEPELKRKCHDTSQIVSQGWEGKKLHEVSLAFFWQRTNAAFFNIFLKSTLGPEWQLPAFHLQKHSMEKMRRERAGPPLKWMRWDSPINLLCLASYLYALGFRLWGFHISNI